MAEEDSSEVTISNAITDSKKNSFSIKISLAQMLRGGVVVVTSSPDQAKIAEAAGACCVSVADLAGRQTGGISRMANPAVSVAIPIMSRSRVGHFVEAMILESIDVDYIDESEELAVADEEHFINKHNFRVPFVCGYVRKLANMDEDEVFAFAEKINAPYDIVARTKQMGRLPVVQFAAGGIVTPADAAMMMQLGCDGGVCGI
uniref:PdxS/SNZ N-terminal domain-containing protein n=1 Tax=Kalanchoe fedtschenkoi TaxID=63787 RepID=A0A7N0RIU1_KALFE